MGEGLTPENPILSMFFCSSLLFSDMILCKVPQERNTEDLTVKNIFYTASKTCPFTADATYFNASYQELFETNVTK